MKVYVLIEQYYDDVTIRGVFSTEKKAKEAKEAFKKDGSYYDMDIEEFELNEQIGLS